MSTHKLSAGDGYTYLTKQVAAHDSTELGQGKLADYYTQKGESPGQWLGAGLAGVEGVEAGNLVGEAQMRALFGEGRHPDADRIEKEILEGGGTVQEALAASALGARFAEYDQEPNQFRVETMRRYERYNVEHGLPREAAVPDDVRSAIRTDVGRQTFVAEHGREPLNERELSGHIARMSRPPRQAVAGYDLTFSPVKSVSTLWAVAPLEVSEAIEAAHAAAARDAIGWLEREVAYTRQGHAGVRQVDVRGLLATAFTHRDSRAGDPDLHTHIAISNKVQTAEGKWLALDGQVLFKATVAASERYNARLEAEVTDRLGVGFAEAPAGARTGKRPVREVVGVSPELMKSWSTRRGQIDARRATLTSEFQDAHGRTPTPKEAIKLAQQANLETREAKHEPRSLAEQRTGWRDHAVAVLGSVEAIQAMVDTVQQSGRRPARRAGRGLVKDLAGQVQRTVEDDRARWQTWHVRAEAERAVKAADVPLDRMDETVDQVVATVLDPRTSITLTKGDGINELDQLLRADGSSVYTRVGSQMYTSQRIVAAEHALLAAAKQTDGRVVPDSVVQVALLEQAANGHALNPAQTQMVTELATSGSRVQLVLAPAGSGKTTAMRVLATAWRDDGGTVIGLAPSAVAAAALRDEIGGDTDTLAKLVHSLSHPDQPMPEWVSTIGPDSLVIIDEAGMAGTPDLASTVEYVTARGGSVRLVGDDQQLAAVGAGGVLRDISEEVGAVTLSELMRFTDPSEAAATLAVRDGSAAAIGFYADRGRLHVADQSTLTDAVFSAWSADRDRGLTSVMVAGTNDQVTELNSRARDARLALDPAARAGVETPLACGLSASTGDLIVTRRNDRKIPITATDWVKNGDRWMVADVRDDGSVAAVHLATGRSITLPAAYVATNVDLGYASTVHGVQGLTVDTCHTALSGTESRQLAYVALTRGALANHVYVSGGFDGDPHAILRPEVIAPPTAAEALAAVIERDGSQRSAHTEMREAADPGRQLGHAAAVYQDAVAMGAARLAGEEVMDAIDAGGEQVLPGLTAAPAWATLRGHLATLALDGQDPIAALQHAKDERELGTALDPAAVLDWRLDTTGAHSAADGPLPWVPGLPTQLRDDPTWGPYLAQRERHVADLADQVRDQAVGADPSSVAAWGRRLLEVPDLAGEVAVWRAGIEVPKDDTRTVGGPHPATGPGRYQRDLARRVDAELGRTAPPGTRWRDTVAELDPHVLTDPYWPVLGEQLDVAADAGIDVPQMLGWAAATGPLPVEYPAAALWWRLAPQLAPTAAVDATTGSGATRLRPPWTPALTTALPQGLDARVMADPAWPALVAAVHTATTNPKDAKDLLERAIGLIDTDAIGRPEGVSRDALATVIAWRVNEITRADTGLAGETDLIGEADLADPDAAEFLRDVAAEHDSDPLSPTSPAVGDSTGITPSAPPAEPVVEADVLDPDLVEPEPATGRPRILELNAQAMDYWSDRYAGSRAADYLRGRLGTDLTGDARFPIGYAPASWTGLTDHLLEAGAEPAELVDAGLARYSRRGTPIDTFRDRLVFGIHNTRGELVGFAARRGPGADDTAGPKYLSSPATAAYNKGAVLYGADQLRADTTPAIVEGPLDAIAVTLAGDGDVVGTAPLGTALTRAHVDLLAGHQQVLVGTDSDDAGRTAASRDYWLLVERGHDPRTLTLGGANDPAQLYADHPEVLSAVLASREHAPCLVTDLVDTIAAANRGGLNDAQPEARLRAARTSARLIAALPPEQWDEQISYTAAQIGPEAAELVYYETLAAALDWDPAAHHREAFSDEPAPSSPTKAQDLAARIDALSTGVAAIRRAQQARDSLAAEQRRQEEQRRRDLPRHDGPSRGPTHHL